MTTDCFEWSKPLSRLLVLLTTMLLLVMPITEHLCNWDKFLRGGPDVEFSVLAWLLFAAMVVLSMNGTMLRPIAMQPESMEQAFAANGGSRGPIFGTTARRMISQSSAKGRLHGRWRDESGSPAEQVDESRGSIPMRI